jgi:hypothetical protein
MSKDNNTMKIETPLQTIDYYGWKQNEAKFHHFHIQFRLGAIWKISCYCLVVKAQRKFIAFEKKSFFFIMKTKSQHTSLVAIFLPLLTT